jgi:hypothetical protein
VTAVLALTGASSSAGAAGFIAPVTLPGVADQPLGADVAAGPDGTVIAVWVRVADGQSQVVGSVRPPGGSFGAPIPISPPGGRAPKIAIDGKGVATVVWEQSSTLSPDFKIQESTRLPGAGFGATVTLSNEVDSSRFPEVAVNSQGATIVTWERETTVTVIDAAARPAGSPDFGPSKQLSQSGTTDRMGNPQVAVGEDGTGMVTWVRGNGLAEASRWTLAAGFAPSVRVAASDDFVDAPDVAVDRQGTAVFAFFGLEGGARGVRVQTRTAGGTFSATSQLAPLPAGPTRPDLTADRAGNLVVTWDEHPAVKGDPVVIRAAVRQSGQAFQGVSTLSGQLASGTRRAQAVSPAGDTIVAWIAPGERVQARVKRKGSSTFGALQNDFPVRPDITDLAAFADGEGNLGTLWRRTGAGDPGTVELRAFDGAAPRRRSLTLPGGAVAGRSAAFAAAFTDTWSPVSVSWGFGDGGTGSGATAQHAYGAAGTFTATAIGRDTAGNATAQSGAVAVRGLRPDEIDADGDGFSAAQDCDEGNAAIRPGALEVPGNAIDENCDGVRAPFPRIGATASLATLFLARATLLSSLKVSGLEGGETVRVSCKGSGCKRRVATTRVIRRKTALLKLDKRVRGVRLRKGARVTVKLSRPGFVTKVVQFTIKLGDAPSKRELCQAPGQRSPGPC